MLKLILATAILGSGNPLAVSQADTRIATEQAPQDDKALEHLSQSYACIWNNQPGVALEHIQHASSMLNQSKEVSFGVDFALSFGKIIAYDHLGLQEQCKQAIGSLLIAINDSATGEQDIEDASTATPSVQDCQEVLSYLRKMAALSQSEAVQSLLLSLIDEMSEIVLPEIAFAPNAKPEKFAWQFDTFGTPDSAHHCGFWKKTIKILKNVGEAIAIIITIKDGIERISS